MRPICSYVLCTSPRSGSTLLCTLLRGSGKAGWPDSHFHEPSLEAWLGYYSLQADQFRSRQSALRAVFDASYALGKGAGDIFGLRLQQHSFDFFAHQLKILYPMYRDCKSRINAVFGETLFVYLTREDKLDQAISFVRAQQSGLWHVAADGTELERLSEPQEPIYDASSIAAQLEIFEQMDARWEQWFAAENLNPLRISYAEISAAPFAVLDRVLKALGLDGETTPPKTLAVTKLADAINLEWAERFRSERSR